MLVDEVLVALGLAMSIGLYAGVFLADHPRARAYAMENPGSPFVLAFVALLVAAAVAFSYGLSGPADQLSECAYAALVLGVVLQAVAAARARGGDPDERNRSPPRADGTRSGPQR